jgi:hypothetical protein
LCALIIASPAFAVAVSITDSDIIPATGLEVHSGNGLLDLILFLEAGGVGVAGNSAGSFNGDNANTDMPTGNGTGKDVFNGTYITSFGDLRDFYDAVYGPDVVNEIVLAVDVNEIGPVNFITLNTLDLIIDYTSPTTGGRNDPFNNDITSATQNSTGSALVGGTLIAALDGVKQLDLTEQGAGLADYFIQTGIDPYDSAYTDLTRIAFHVALSDLDNGGETIFLSGEFGGGGPQEIIPEPASLALLVVGLTGLWALRKRRKA